eukprot:TRINITY_DN41780_c0_g1_i1.p1 TRINITY_DN41780_c0_g1~~TRINITY_DN41780_c0_g1_i1.p1  ORF type:complete len:420 (+),score=47.40 TRINITY_DN41780_c0_g1_i1:64-1323(+)
MAHSDPSGKQLNVMTLNMCVLAAGLSNRFLPYQILGGSILVTIHIVTGFVMMAGMTFWLALIIALLGLPISMFTLGLAASRLLAPIWYMLGFNDFKIERIETFLKMLKEKQELRDVDVLCVQECYGALVWDGGYPEILVKAARDAGFNYAAVPDRTPSFPATLAQNSGLLILSKMPILHSNTLTFGLSLECSNVNRGALHAEIEGGIHIFTCHISPAASVAGDGIAAFLLGPLYDRARTKQVSELAAFVASCAPENAPVLLAGDLNLDLSFSRGIDEGPDPSMHALLVLKTLQEMCKLEEATSQSRGSISNSDAKESQNNNFPTLRHFRPTFGHTGSKGLPAERWITSYGDGKLRSKTDDAIFSRGCRVREIREDALCIPKDWRFHDEVTFVSDHWALRAAVELPSHTEFATTHSIENS